MPAIPTTINRELFWKHCASGSAVTIESDGKQWPAEVVSHSEQLLVVMNSKTGAQLKFNTKLFVFDKATTRSIRLIRANGKVITVITPATNWDKVLAAHQEQVHKSLQGNLRKQQRRQARPLKLKQYISLAITDRQFVAARALGEGNVSLGIRRAIAAATGVESEEIKAKLRTGKKSTKEGHAKTNR